MLNRDTRADQPAKEVGFFDVCGGVAVAAETLDIVVGVLLPVFFLFRCHHSSSLSCRVISWITVITWWHINTRLMLSILKHCLWPFCNLAQLLLLVILVSIKNETKPHLYNDIGHYVTQSQFCGSIVLPCMHFSITDLKIVIIGSISSWDVPVWWTGCHNHITD